MRRTERRFRTAWALACQCFVVCLVVVAVPLYGSTEVTPTKSQSKDWIEDQEAWQNAAEITANQLEVWRQATGKLGDEAAESCTYVRKVAPCDCPENPYPRAYFEAATHSLTDPGLGALGSWFDPPVVHDVKSWVLERYDPTVAERWVLISMDGQQPTERQLKNYWDEKVASAFSHENRKAEREGRRERGFFHPANPRWLFFNLEPNVVLEASDTQLVLGYQPPRFARPKVARRIQQVWVVDNVNRHMSAFAARLTRQTSPHMGLLFKDFRHGGTFAYNSTTQSTALEHYEYEFRTRLTVVFNLHRREKAWFSQFECTT